MSEQSEFGFPKEIIPHASASPQTQIGLNR